MSAEQRREFHEALLDADTVRIYSGEVAGSDIEDGAEPTEAADRWQRGAFVGAVYLGDVPETVWAEWYRHLAEPGIPAAEFPRGALEVEGRCPRCQSLD